MAISPRKKKNSGGGKKRRELIRSDPRNRRHHQNERTFSPNSRRTMRILRSKRHILEIYLGSFPLLDRGESLQPE